MNTVEIVLPPEATEIVVEDAVSIPTLLATYIDAKTMRDSGEAFMKEANPDIREIVLENGEEVINPATGSVTTTMRLGGRYKSMNGVFTAMVCSFDKEFASVEALRKLLADGVINNAQFESVVKPGKQTTLQVKFKEVKPVVKKRK